MTHEEVMAMVEEIGLPFAYHHFAEGEGPDPPFVVPELETVVETVLERHGIFYGKSEVWIDSEKLYEVLFEMEV